MTMITDRKTIEKWVSKNARVSDIVNYIMRKQREAWNRGYSDGFHTGYTTGSNDPYYQGRRDGAK